jgi:uncharacterized protein
MAKEETVAKAVEWANPGALGLAAFGFNTMLLQLHNIGWMTSTLPLVYGFFWGGMAQVIAGIIDARRGDTFGLTAFTSYGLFWIGLSMYFLLQWTKVIQPDNNGLAWTFVLWGIFTFFMMFGTFKMSVMHTFVFASLTILFILLALHFSTGVKLSEKYAGVEGLFCGASAAYGAAAVVLQSKYGRWVLPICQYK